MEVKINNREDVMDVSVTGKDGAVDEVSRTGGVCRDLSSISEEDRALLSVLDTRPTRPLYAGRFLSMQRRRRKRLVTRKLVAQQALLDDLYHSPTLLALDRLSSWNFNAFSLDTVTGGRSVPVLGTHLLKHLGVINNFKLDLVNVWKFFCLIERGYHNSNPYHNSIHAADVTQAMYCFLTEPKIKEHVTSIEILAAIIAAVCHDLDHPGVNQPFLIATSNHLAQLYKNASVLENHHWRMACGCLVESGILSDLSRSDSNELIVQMRSLILATDIARQSEFISQFKEYTSNGSLDMEQAEHRHFILQISLKCADISNPCRPWDISQKWSRKVCDEFYRQGDYERRLKLPLTTLCDRVSSSVAKIQVGFFRHVVRPLFIEWNAWMGTSLAQQMSLHLDANQARWEKFLQHETDEEARTEISDDLNMSINDISLESLGGDDYLANLSYDNFDTEASLSELRELLTTPARANRRHSAPLIVARPVARTFIRRESMPTAAPEAMPSSSRRMHSDTILHLSEDGSNQMSRLPTFFRCQRLSEETVGELEHLTIDEADRESQPTPVTQASIDLSTDLLLPELSITSITATNSPSPISGTGWTPAPSPTPTLPRRFTLESVVSSDSTECWSRRRSLLQSSENKTLRQQNEGAYRSTLSSTMTSIDKKKQQKQKYGTGNGSLVVPPVSTTRRCSEPALYASKPQVLMKKCTGDFQLEFPGAQVGSTVNPPFSAGKTKPAEYRAGSSWRRNSQPCASVAHRQISKLRVALLLRLKAALSVDTHGPPPANYAHRRGSLPTDLITICSPR